MKMIATRDLRYATRRLKAGDGFEAKTKRDANLLVAIGKARLDGGSGPAARAPDPATDIGALRDRYTTLFGRKPYMGWDAETLTAKIAAAAAEA